MDRSLGRLSLRFEKIADYPVCQSSHVGRKSGRDLVGDDASELVSPAPCSNGGALQCRGVGEPNLRQNIRNCGCGDLLVAGVGSTWHEAEECSRSLVTPTFDAREDRWNLEVTDSAAKPFEQMDALIHGVSGKPTPRNASHNLLGDQYVVERSLLDHRGGPVDLRPDHTRFVSQRINCWVHSPARYVGVVFPSAVRRGGP